MTRLRSLLPERPPDAAFLPWYVALTKIFHSRSMGYANIFISVLTMLNFIMIAELRMDMHLGDTLGIPQSLVYGLIVVLIPIALVTVGYLDYRLKIQQHENILLYEHLSPRGKEMLQNSRIFREFAEAQIKKESEGK